MPGKPASRLGLKAPRQEQIEAHWRETVRRRLRDDPDFNPLAYTLEDGPLMWIDNRIVRLDGVENTFDSAGNLIRRKDKDGAILELSYDGAHRLSVLRRSNPDGTKLRERWGKQPLRFQGQYFDEESGFYYNRWRYYDPKQGRYITQDPIGLAGGLNGYVYPMDPVGGGDPLGLDACYVHFPDYPVAYNDAGDTSTWLGGQAGVLTYDKDGNTRYYEYGRYAPNSSGLLGEKLPKNTGNVRRVSVPNLKMDKDGKPTPESMSTLEGQLSTKAGKGTSVKLTCNEKSNPEKVHAYVENIANDQNREKYNWNPFSPNHCRSFAKKAVSSGE